MHINGDTGFPSMQRMQEMLQQRFATADTNGDGGLTLEEFSAVGQKLPPGVQKPEGAPSEEDAFNEMDADGNGVVTQQEMERHFEANFAEISSAMQSLLLQAQGGAKAGGGDGGPDLVELLSSDSEEEEEAGETDETSEDSGGNSQTELERMLQQYMDIYASGANGLNVRTNVFTSA